MQVFKIYYNEVLGDNSPMNIYQLMSSWLYKYGILFLRISLAIVFFWFGILKPLGMSPANGLIEKTVFWFDPEVFIPILGYWEAAIGLFMLYRPLVKWSILLLFLQMPGTALPLFILPEFCFESFPFGLTLEGQYIIKNLVLISAAIVVGGNSTSQNPNNKRKQLY
jgi:uncharacterized membrane protein YkgB